MTLTDDQRKQIFYPLQRKVNKWLEQAFTHYTCNYQSFDNDGKHVFENFTCVKQDKSIVLVLIDYRINDDLEASQFYTYTHETKFN